MKSFFFSFISFSFFFLINRKDIWRAFSYLVFSTMPNRKDMLELLSTFNRPMTDTCCTRWGQIGPAEFFEWSAWKYQYCYILNVILPSWMSCGALIHCLRLLFYLVDGNSVATSPSSSCSASPINVTCHIALLLGSEFWIRAF